MIVSLRCIVCARRYEPADRLTCDTCGPAEGILDAEYDYEQVRRRLTRQTLAQRPFNQWRYRELLPVDLSRPLPALSVGWTPLYPAERLGSYLGVGRLFLKDDGRNPTASFKDRASSVGVMKALEFGYTTIACASTGNAASSLAGFAAASGLRSFIFVPERAPEPKLAQLLVFGANVIRVRGSYDQAYELCMQAAAKRRWYNRNCAVNCYLVEGKKTAGMEIAEQMGEELADWVAVSVGDGCTLAGVWKGLKEMHAIGLLSRLPRLLGVQAEGAAAVVRQFESPGEAPFEPAGAATIADSICVGVPRNWRKAVRAVRESGGTFVTVPDEAICEALCYMPRLTGVFGEPAAVASVAGVKAARMRGIVAPGESVVALVTGNGLKDIKTASSIAGTPFEINPTVEDLERSVPGCMEDAKAGSLR